MEGTKIKFMFQPFGEETGQHVIEKADNKGTKRKYLCGISSGILVDGHGERMTEKCIQRMHDQGNAGDIQLFSGLHGVDFADDIGLLAKSDIVNSQDWYTEYRLYDEGDDVGAATMDRVKKVWKQINGLPPYKRSRKFGFSIEGIIPENAIIDGVQMSNGEMVNRVIDQVDLDGTVLVTRPAYETSVATAVYKALGEFSPDARKGISEKIGNIFDDAIGSAERERNFFSVYYEIQDVLESEIRKAMCRKDARIEPALRIVFDQYVQKMLPFCIENSEFLRLRESSTDPAGDGAVRKAQIYERVGKIAETLKKLSRVKE